jgi:hypothetical protein
MITAPLPYYTRKTLAETCGVGVDQITIHTKLGTAHLNKAAERIPGLGLRYKGPQALRFIQMMQAKHGRKEVAS